MGGVHDKITSLLKTNTTDDYSNPTGVKNAYGGGTKPRKLKIQKQSEDNIFNNIRNLFRLKQENEAIKDRIIRDIKNLFEQEEDYYKPARAGNFYTNNYIEYQSNVLLHNRDLSEYVLPYRSFDESFSYHEQSLRDYKNRIL